MRAFVPHTRRYVCSRPLSVTLESSEPWSPQSPPDDLLDHADGEHTSDECDQGGEQVQICSFTHDRFPMTDFYVSQSGLSELEEDALIGAFGAMEYSGESASESSDQGEAAESTIGDG